LKAKHVFWYSPQILSATFIILRRIQLVFVISVHRSACNVRVNACQILMKLEFLDRLSKNLQCKIRL
jgi:hypothetical protein